MDLVDNGKWLNSVIFSQPEWNRHQRHLIVNVARNKQDESSVQQATSNERN